MNRCLLRRSNLALYPIDRPPGVVRRFYDDDARLSVLRLLDPMSGQFQRLHCRIFHNQDGECCVFLERSTSLQHDVYGDLLIPAGWWIAREELIDRNDIATQSTPMKGPDAGPM